MSYDTSHTLPLFLLSPSSPYEEMEVDPENPWHDHCSSVQENSKYDDVDEWDEGQPHTLHGMQVETSKFDDVDEWDEGQLHSSHGMQVETLKSVDQRDKGQFHDSHGTKVNPKAPLKAKKVIYFLFRESNGHLSSMKIVLAFHKDS